MASFVYNRGIQQGVRGTIDYDTDVFKVMLCTSAYTPNKDTHDFRDDATPEVTGTGYTAGGNVVTVTETLDTANDRVDVTLGGTTWPTSTITARYAVYYKSRGGASSADELVAVVDFGSDVITSASLFTLTSSILRYSNP